jgi:hypothetical protein
MDLARLQELKHKLLHEDKLGPVWTFFLDHFAENPDFIALGEQTHDVFVETVIAEVGRQLFGKAGAVGGLILTRLAEPPFVHGAFHMGGRIGGVIFFEEARMGMLAIADVPPGIEAKYARFSGRPFPKTSGQPSPN